MNSADTGMKPVKRAVTNGSQPSSTRADMPYAVQPVADSPKGNGIQKPEGKESVHQYSEVMSPQPSSTLADITNTYQSTEFSKGAKNDQKTEEEQPEHPDAPAIRRQVEYYFSDENLPTDLHMLQCTGGRQNLPVSINRICGFKRMRAFKPKRIVAEALRKSTFLEVSEDGKMVKRRVPLMVATAIDPESDEDDGEIAYDPNSAPAPAVQDISKPAKVKVPLLNQTKKEIPPGLTKGMLKPTGFEDSYVEGPITPAQADEELALYDPEKPFVERIEIAIQRFKQKRRMHEMYSKVFNKWMRFGGVECSPRMFGGKPSQAEMKDMDAEEIAKVLATHHVPWDREDEEEWVVDFEALAKGFLSSFYPAHFGHNPKQVKTACQVLRSFYNYILLHNVCPEYEASILAARKICDLAEGELVKADQAGTSLPGRFNMAASILFGGYHAQLYAGNSSWADGEEDLSSGWAGDDPAGISRGMKEEEALVVFKTSVAIFGSDELVATLERDGVKGMKPLKTETVGLNVERIELPTQDVLQIYEQQNQAWKHKLHFSPLGKLHCTPFVSDDFSSWDLPPGASGTPPPAKQAYEFWLEQEILENCFQGMKIEAKVMLFDGGMMVLDCVSEVHPSFFVWLPNELWMEHKPKDVKVLKRGAEAEEERERVLTEAAANGGAEGKSGDEDTESGMSD